MKKQNDTPLTWPAAYPPPNYTDFPSPAAALLHGANYDHAPQFNSPYFNCCAPQLITMSGRRATDRNRLRAAATGFNPAARLGGYDCHHIYDFAVTAHGSQCTAQFILRAQHIASYQHAGAVDQYKAHHGSGYTAVYEAGDSSANDGSYVDDDIFLVSPKSYTDSDIHRFETAFSVKMPSWMKEVYTKLVPVAASFKFPTGAIEIVQATAPLFSEAKHECGADTILKHDELKKSLKDFKAIGAIPFAFDPCGNIFFALGENIFFFDHECYAFTEVAVIKK